MDTIVEAKNLLADILKNSEIDKGHGIDHAQIVMGHTHEALKVCDISLSEDDKTIILLSALLHDADDRKFFPTHRNNENTRFILEKVLPNREQIHTQIIQNIENVSFSKNGNTLLKSGIDNPFMYPCIADRCEATGLIGIQRCYEYTLYVKRPLDTPETVKCTTLRQLDRVCKSRLEDYLSRKFSVSFIDHFYDKIYSLSDINIPNPYFQKILDERHQVIVDFLLEYGRTNKIPKFDTTGTKIPSIRKAQENYFIYFRDDFLKNHLGKAVVNHSWWDAPKVFDTLKEANEYTRSNNVDGQCFVDIVGDEIFIDNVDGNIFYPMMREMERRERIKARTDAEVNDVLTFLKEYIGDDCDLALVVMHYSNISFIEIFERRLVDVCCCLHSYIQRLFKMNASQLTNPLSYREKSDDVVWYSLCFPGCDTIEERWKCITSRKNDHLEKYIKRHLKLVWEAVKECVGSDDRNKIMFVPIPRERLLDVLNKLIEKDNLKKANKVDEEELKMIMDMDIKNLKIEY